MTQNKQAGGKHLPQKNAKSRKSEARPPKKGGFLAGLRASAPQTVQQSIPEEIMKKMEEYLFENGNALMELGYKEGLYTECDPVKRRLAMAGLIAQFLFTVSPEAGRFQMKMDQKAAKEFVYDGMLKVLNKA